MAEIGKICANWDTTLARVLLRTSFSSITWNDIGRASDDCPSVLRKVFNILMMCEHHTSVQYSHKGRHTYSIFHVIEVYSVLNHIDTLM